MSARIDVGRGHFAIVDEADLDWLTARGPWHTVRSHDQLYAVHTEYEPPSTFRGIYMHKLVLPTVQMVDHINRNSLDNRRANLRPANDMQNSRNRRKRADSRQPFKGIGSGKAGAKKPWTASITVAGKTHHLGSFATAECAAIAYDTAALEHFGEFAVLNFPKEPS